MNIGGLHGNTLCTSASLVWSVSATCTEKPSKGKIQATDLN